MISNARAIKIFRPGPRIQVKLVTGLVLVLSGAIEFTDAALGLK
jgi:hypothetical protein